MFDTILNFRYIWDTLDIVLVAFIIYYALTMIEGTRALQVLFGLVLLFVLFYLSQGGLFTLNWILGGAVFGIDNTHCRHSFSA